jgi:hypothetical protein
MFERQSRLPLRSTRRKKSNGPTRSRMWRFVATVTLIALASAYVAFAAISLSTSIPYTQNFTSMGIPLTNPAPSTLPADFRADTISAVRTLGVFGAASAQTNRVGGANVSTIAANGSYNFGAGTSTLGDADRAAGFISSGTATTSGNLYAQFVNNTGDALTGLSISYDVEKYRNGSNPAGFRYQLFYSFDGSAWTNAGPNFFTSSSSPGTIQSPREQPQPTHRPSQSTTFRSQESPPPLLQIRPALAQQTRIPCSPVSRRGSQSPSHPEQIRRAQASQSPRIFHPSAAWLTNNSLTRAETAATRPQVTRSSPTRPQLHYSPHLDLSRCPSLSATASRAQPMARSA